jgi:UDP-N-acetylmuramate dehydrogenase
MYQKIFRKLKTNLRGRIRSDELLANHTSYRIGGAADFYIYPADLVDLQTLLTIVQKFEMPRFIIGKGTNLLVSDAGFRGVLIDVSKTFNQVDIDGSSVTAGSGVLLENVIQTTIRSGLTGFEKLSGIPGSIGGAVTLNAGAFGVEIQDILTSITIVDHDLAVRTLAREDIVMDYRYTDIAPEAVIIEAGLRVKSGSAAELANIRNDILARRAARQPLEYPSAGSVFKRPPGDYAGRLIEAAGLKGFRIGDAMVSEKHANFIINCGAASAEDVRRIIDKIQDTVRQEFEVELKTEIHFLGF